MGLSQSEEKTTWKVSEVEKEEKFIVAEVYGEDVESVEIVEEENCYLKVEEAGGYAESCEG